jgi:hypothetical protein
MQRECAATAGPCRLPARRYLMRCLRGSWSTNQPSEGTVLEALLQPRRRSRPVHATGHLATPTPMIEPDGKVLYAAGGAETRQRASRLTFDPDDPDAVALYSAIQLQRAQARVPEPRCLSHSGWRRAQS